MTQVFADPNNITTPLQSIGYINQLTDVGSGPMFGTIVYFLLTAALFMGMKSFTTERAALAALLITSILAILLRIFGWVNDFAVYLGIILLIFSFWQLKNKND